MLQFLWLSLLSHGLALQAAPGLEQSLRDYWAALAAGDKARALQFVHPQDLNKFLKRREPPFQGWELTGIEFHSEQEAVVTVTISRLYPGGAVLPVPARETWQKVESGWKVRIQSLEDYQRRLDQVLKSRVKLPPQLDVLPEELKFYAGADQPGVIVIRNGLQSPVQVAGLEIDEQRFQVGKKLKEVPARSVGRIAIRYIGEETQADLQSRLALRLKVGEEVRRFEIPILYNYADPMLDWLRGRPKPPK